MRRKWYQTVGSLLGAVLILGCYFAVGYKVTLLISAATGRPSETMFHVLSGIVSIVLFVLSWRLMFMAYSKSHKSRPHVQVKMIQDTLDAMDRISQGDFDVFIPGHKHGPYGELANSVNQMAKELGTMEKARQDFISNVSHEIQSPLTSISGFAALLKQEGIQPEQVQRYASIIETESLRLSKLSDNLLKLSTLEADITQIEKKEFRLDKQIESILLMLEPHWAKKKIMPEVSLPKIKVNGDEDMLSQVWINLLHNAIKFTPNRDTIRISLEQEESVVRCSISDHGPGIDPKDQVHIFERFYKVDKSRDRGLGGNGLGLSLVKKIVEIHGGHVFVKSKLGEGAEFIVELPIQ